MNYTPFIPQEPPLAGAIEVVFALDGYLPEHKRERLVPNGRMNLVIELDGRPRHIYENESGTVRQVCRAAWLSGLQTQYITIGDTDEESKLLAVQIAPGASAMFTHRPASEFVDTVVPAQSVFGESVLSLRDRLMQLADPIQRIRVAANWLTDLHNAEFAAPDYTVDGVQKIIANPGEVRLDKIGEGACVSRKHFIDQFRKFVGVTPKTLQRIFRLSQIFEAIQNKVQVNWSELSVELGFSDQAHLIREFHGFSGFRPASFHATGPDRPNFFPDD